MTSRINISGVQNNNNDIALGINLMRSNRLNEAKAVFKQICEWDAYNVDAWYLLSCVNGMQGNVDEAGRCCYRVIALRPKHSEAHVNLGNVLYYQGQLDEAVLHYKTALRSKPKNAIGYNSLGNVLKEQGKIDDAIESYRRAIKLRPEYITAYANLAITFISQGKLGMAERLMRKALKSHPNDVNLLSVLGNILIKQGKTNSGLELYQNALRLSPTNSIVHSDLLMSMQYHPAYSAESLFEAAKAWGSAHSTDVSSFPSLDIIEQSRKRLRLAYVSGDFCNHPVGYFIESVLSHHDKSQFEVFGYYNNTRHDDLTLRLQESCEHWRNIVGESDNAVTEKIREDKIDILVDLSGHTGNNRLLTFAQKPAPVQVTWMGYCATTGLSAMDYIMGDRFLIPGEEERYYVEQVHRLPNAYLCFSPPGRSIECGPLPALNKGKITFGCFNNTAKLTDRVIACWSTLMHALPQAQLYLKYKSFGDDGVRQRYQRLFTKHDVDSSRIRFAGSSPREEHLAAYQEVDIALDPFPYNGGTTTMESLWMGVPVVTLRGDRYVSHVGETILKNLGLPEYVTDCEEAYITQAIALASDIPSLAELRGGLRDRLLNSVLCDGQGFARDLEAAYRQMWEAWCHKGARALERSTPL